MLVKIKFLMYFAKKEGARGGGKSFDTKFDTYITISVVTIVEFLSVSREIQ